MDDQRETSWSPAAPTALITLSDAKTFLGITDASVDALLTRLVNSATAQIEAFCGRPLAGERTITETIFHEAIPTWLTVSYRPMNALTSLTIEDVAATLGDFDVRLNAGLIKRKDGSNAGGKKVVAVYTIGYTSPPDDLKQAALEFVRAGYQASTRGTAVKSESVDGVGSVTYLDGTPMVRSPSGYMLPWQVAAYLGTYTRTFAP